MPIKTVSAAARERASASGWFRIDPAGPAEDAVEAFKALAQAQRGAPERAMLDVQRINGGGVLGPVVEHAGDLTNTLTRNMRLTGGRGRPDIMVDTEAVLDKAVKVRKWITDPYGWRREHQEGLRGADHERRVRTALDAYVKAHMKLPVYNEPQFLARQAAIEIGLLYENVAARTLKMLIDLIKSPHWTDLALSYFRDGGGRIEGIRGTDRYESIPWAKPPVPVEMIAMTIRTVDVATPPPKVGPKDEPQSPRPTPSGPRKKPDGPGPGYVAVHPEPGHARALAKWAAGCGLRSNVPMRQLHVDVMHDPRNKRFDKAEQRRGAIYSSRPTSVAMIGGDLAVLLDSKDLIERHRALTDAGYVHSRPQYRPHIVIKKGASDEEFLAAIGCVDRLLKALPRITLYREAWTKVKASKGKGGGAPRKAPPKAKASVEDASLDRPYKWTLIDSDPHFRSAEFDLPHGDRWDVMDMSISAGAVQDMGVLEFEARDEMGNPTLNPTGEGDAFRILATVIDFAAKGMKAMRLKALAFSGRGRSRIKLYRRMAKIMARRHRLNVHEAPTHDGARGFYLSRRSAPARLLPDGAIPILVASTEDAQEDLDAVALKVATAVAGMD